MIGQSNSAEYADLCQLLAHSPAVLYSCGPPPDCATTFVSDNVIDQLGHSPQDFYDQPFFWTDLLHPDDAEQVREELRKIESKDRVSYEYRIRHRDGHYLWMHDQLTVIRDSSGRVSTLVGSWFDITERKRIEQALAEQASLSAFAADVQAAFVEKRSLEDTLRCCVEAMVKHLDAALARIWTLNKTETLLTLQASAGMYTHLDGKHSRIPLGQLKIGKIAQAGKPHLTNTVIGDPSINDQEWAKRTGMVAFAGYPLLVDCQTVGVMAMFSCNPLNDSTLRGMSTVAQVIALGIERSQSEAALRRAERLASIGTLAAGIAHEINNPITAISLAAQRALANPSKFDRHPNDDECFESIVRDAERCSRIINNVLQFSRIGVTKESPNDMNQIVRQVVSALRAYAEERCASMELDLDQNLPAAIVNPGQFEQVLLNLVSNALESGEDGNRVVIRTRQGRGVIRVRVSDQGRGMSNEQKSRMFDPFYTTRGQEGGTGLGLSIVHGIVVSHGGTIDVDSRPGRGTAITIELPGAPNVAK